MHVYNRHCIAHCSEKACCHELGPTPALMLLYELLCTNTMSPLLVSRVAGKRLEARLDIRHRHTVARQSFASLT